MTDRPLTTGEGNTLVEELREALDDPKRGEWGGYPWEHLGDAERDVRVLLADHGRLREQLDAARQAQRDALLLLGQASGSESLHRAKAVLRKGLTG